MAASLLKDHLPFTVIAVLLVTLDALATGALHFDGLADTADGFGGGKSRDDVLRIMRDHAIGSYGGLALALLVTLKVTAYAALLQQRDCIPALILDAGVGPVVHPAAHRGVALRPALASVIEGMGRRSLFWGTVSILIAMVAVTGY